MTVSKYILQDTRSQDGLVIDYIASDTGLFHAKYEDSSSLSRQYANPRQWKKWYCVKGDLRQA